MSTKSIDKDLEDLSLFIVGVMGTCASEERIAQRDIDEQEGGTPQEVDLLEKTYQLALKHENEARAANQIVHRLEEEIRKLRGEADGLKKALIAHHSLQKCRCVEFGFCAECTCWLSLNTGPNGECEKCRGIRKPKE